MTVFQQAPARQCNKSDGYSSIKRRSYTVGPDMSREVYCTAGVDETAVMMYEYCTVLSSTVATLPRTAVALWGTESPNQAFFGKFVG